MSPSSLVICNSERKKKLVCGLIRRRARPSRVSGGAMAMPLEPRRPSSSRGQSAGDPRRGPFVESGELLKIGALDVAADAAFGEGERHPGLEAGEDARADLRMGREIVVQAGRPGVHQRAQPGGAAAIIGLELDRIDP